MPVENSGVITSQAEGNKDLNLSRVSSLRSLPCTIYLTAAPPSASLVVRAFCNFHNYWLNSQNGGGRAGYSL